MSLLGTACASQGPLIRPEPPPDAEYGTPHPFVAQVVSPNGRWFMACQAREDTNQDGRISVRFDRHGGSGHGGERGGDALRPYLFLEPGAGLAIDELLGWDRSGRYVVFVHEGMLRLFDSLSGQEQVLSPGPLAASLSPQPPLRASFSRDGTRLLYLRPEGGKTVAVLRDLAQGTEHMVDSGGGLAGQVILDDAGRWAVVDVVTEDTDKDGQLTWPEPQTNLAPALCRGPVMSSSHFGWKGDRPTRRMRHLEAGPLFEGQDVLQSVGDRMLRRLPDGAIVAEDAHGKREEWVPARCGGLVLSVDAPRRQLLVACGAQGEEASLPLELHGPALHQPLGWSVHSAGAGMRSIDGEGNLRRVSAMPDAQSEAVDIIVDLERRAVVKVPVPGARVRQTGATYVLLSEKVPRADTTDSHPAERVWLWNVATGAQRQVGMASMYAQDRVQDLVLYMGWLVDLGTGAVLGTVTEEPLGFDARGRSLYPVRPDPQEAGVPQGPVRWGPATQPAGTNTTATSAPSP
ncbi:hypothetical protein [Myxococcus sp. Y35]|uniref:hypothetical protein n=1 Tax=Pseudomyxococcus flavus TaxID=3115648 RepID=UPI003CF435ED